MELKRRAAQGRGYGKKARHCHRETVSVPEAIAMGVFLFSMVSSTPVAVGGASYQEIEDAWEAGETSFETPNGALIHRVEQVAGDSVISIDGTILRDRLQKRIEQGERDRDNFLRQLEEIEKVKSDSRQQRSS